MPTKEALRAQVATRADTNGAVAHPDKPQTVYQLLETQRDQIARALPRHLDADRLSRIVLTQIRQNPALASCDAMSLMGAVMTCAQLGLEPGPTGEAYLVPFGNQVTFIPGYRGLIKLAWQSGQLASISAETVYANDTFAVTLGTNPTLEHTPPAGWPQRHGVARGQACAYYATATLKSGGTVFVVMSRDDIEKIRSRSRAKNSGPWVSDYDAMARKTCVRQLIKWLPLNAEAATAAAHDEGVRTDYTTPVEETVPQFIDADVVDDTTSGPPSARPVDEVRAEVHAAVEDDWPPVAGGE